MNDVAPGSLFRAVRLAIPGQPLADERVAAEAPGAGEILVRVKAAGHEAVCVSHQLPVWTLRRHLEKKHLWHFHRECNLASLTSLTYEGINLVDVSYSEPAEC